MKSKLVVGAVAASVASVVWGQQQGQGQAQGQGLEEIVVTATRREQNLQDVPISIVAITGDTLELRGLDSLEDVGQSVPNVVITGGGGGTGSTSFRMRGIPNVGTYVDGVWQVGTGGILDAGARRHRSRRSPAWPAGHDVRPRLHGRRAAASGPSGPPKSSAPTSRPRSAALDRRDVKVTLDLPLGEKLLTNGRRRAFIATATSRAKRPAEARRHRPDGVSRRHRLDAHRQARFPLQLPRQRERSSPSRVSRTRFTTRSISSF